jgi:DNA-binding transcriptional MerR regulator
MTASGILPVICGLIYNFFALMEFKVPEKQTFKIGEVCEMMQVEPYVLRYWETEFEDLQPPKNAMGQRVYRTRDIEVVYLIKKLLYEEGYTIAGARKQLRKEIVKQDSGSTYDSEHVQDELKKIQGELREILTLLERDSK